MAIATNWTREQVESLLKTEQFRYQRIELPYGLATEGSDRSATARRILPDDLTGKSVLDLGCSHGFFCFEAAKRGASRVVGLDVEADVIRKNRLLADCLGAKVEFGTCDIERQVLTEEFDYVLCLNVLHHLKNPLSVLDNLVAIARERLVLEMASFGGHDRRRLGLFPGLGALLARLPIIYVSKNGTTGKQQLKKFFMTQGALHNLLVHHRHVYARVDMQPSDHKGRYIVIAQRQKIEHLILVAGPTGAGKSTFCDRFLKGELAGVAAQVGATAAPSEMTFLSARVKDNPGQPQLGTVVFHYDILRPFMRSSRVHSRDEGLDVLAAAGKTTVLTLWTSPEKLMRQFAQTLSEEGQKPDKRQRAIQQHYAEPRRILEHYDEWFAFLATQKADTLVVDQSHGAYRLLTLAEWQEQVKPLRKQA